MQKIDFLGCDEEVSRKEGKSTVNKYTNNAFAPQKTESSKK